MRLARIALITLLVITVVSTVACEPDTSTYYKLTTYVAMGQGEIYPSTGYYLAGTRATLTATPDGGWVFSYWGNQLSGTDNPATIYMDSDKSVYAYFAQKTSPYSVQKTSPPVDENSIYREYEWSYGGYKWTWEITIPKNLYQYFQELTRPTCEKYSCDYSTLIINPEDDYYIESLVSKLNDAAEEQSYNQWETVNFAVAFVQSLPYTYDNVSTPYDEYARSPIETLVDNGGDCEDTSILMAAILDEMGYGVVLIYFPYEHMGVGIKGGEGISGTYWNHNGAKYYYLETTGKGSSIGQLPPSHQGKTAYVYDLVPKPILSSSWAWSTPDYHYFTLTISVKNEGTATANDVYVQAGFDAGNNQWLNSEQSSTFDVATGGSVDVTISLTAPAGQYTRLEVLLWDDGELVTKTYSTDWFSTY